jgi:uroporphyrinogen-III decarboxylase
MTGKQRVLNAFRHIESDFVPVSDQLIVSKVASEILGRYAYTGGGEFSKDVLECLINGERDFLVERYTQDTLEVHQKLGLDFIRIGTVPPGSEEENLQKLDADTYLYRNEETGNYSIYRFSESSGQFFCVESSLNKEGMPALEREIKLIEKKISEPINYTGTGIFEAWDKIVEKSGSEMAISFSAGIGIPMEPVHLEALVTKPEWIEIYLDYQTKQCIEFIKEAKKHGADFILGGADLATAHGPIYSPEIFRKMLLPRYRKILEVCHFLKLPYIYRSDGNTKPFWEIWFNEIGFDGYAEIDKSAGMDLGELKERFGDKITLIGNVDCARTLVSGTKEEIENEVRDCIRKAAKGAGYILTSSNSIHYNIPAKNFLFMVEAARKYGRYPVEI